MEVAKGPSLYAVVAEFRDEHELIRAAEKAREAGYTRLEAYTPFPVHGVSEAIGFEDNRLKWMIFFGGVFGAISGVLLQWWVSAVAYPHNVGGRPYFSWPNFIPITFECMVLFAALTAVFGMFALNGLPKPYHPIFNTPKFDRASQDLFFLAIEARDPMFDAAAAAKCLKDAGADNVSEVNMDEEGSW